MISKGEQDEQSELSVCPNAVMLYNCKTCRNNNDINDVCEWVVLVGRSGYNDTAQTIHKNFFSFT